MEPMVFECNQCGRLWVGYTGARMGPGYTNSPKEYLSAEDQDQVWGYSGHAIYQSKPYPPGPVRSCPGSVVGVYRPAVIAAFLLQGREAAEAMVDGQLKRSLEEFEARELAMMLEERTTGRK